MRLLNIQNKYRRILTIENCKVILSIEDDLALIFEVARGIYIYVVPEAGLVKVISNWIHVLRWCDYAKVADKTHKDYELALQRIKEHEDEICEAIDKLWKSPADLLICQDELLEHVKPNQKIIY